MKVAQSCLTLCDPMDYTVHGILQARIPEWVAVPFSRGSSQPRDQIQVSLIAGGFFTVSATRALTYHIYPEIPLMQKSIYVVNPIFIRKKAVPLLEMLTISNE